jgi:hypothetical protein
MCWINIYHYFLNPDGIILAFPAEYRLKLVALQNLQQGTECKYNFIGHFKITNRNLRISFAILK